MTTQSELRNHVWQACTAIRNEHRDVKKYVEYTAILLFFKFYDDVFESLPADIRGLIPEQYRWKSLKALDPRGFAGYHAGVLGRLREFFDQKKWRGKRTYGTVFENFQFDIKHDEVLGRALLALDRIDFAGLAYDQKGDVYEFLIGKMADAGVKGEFFTPRPIVNMVIDVLRPRFGLRVWDPACGTGGFLTRAFEEMLADLKRRHPEGTPKHVQQLQALRTECIYGNETEAVSARLARMNMILRGDGHSNIVEFNSLDRQTYTQRRLEIRGSKEANPIPAILDGGGFDLIMANPPYGGSQAVCDVGAQFKPWQPSKKPEANFLQIMMKALKEGGTCGVLMPEGILFRREEAKIRERLLKEFDFQGIVGLFKGAFEFADVKACVLFFRRPLSTERWKGSRYVWIGDASTFGEIELAGELFRKRESGDIGRPVPVEQIIANKLNMMISKYRPRVESRSILMPLDGLIIPKRVSIDPSSDPDKMWPVYGVNNKTGVEPSEGRAGADFRSPYQRIAKGDFVYNPTRVHVGSVGRVQTEDPDAITSPEYVVFNTASDLHPDYLLYLMKTDQFRQRAALVARGSIKHRLYVECLQEIELPIPKFPQQVAVVDRLRAQDALIQRCDGLLATAHTLDWLDDDIFRVETSDRAAENFGPMIEDVSDYVDPAEHPDTEWKVYGVTNDGGVRLGEVKPGRDFKAGRRYKRLVHNALVYNPQRVNVGSVGIAGETDSESLVSPYYVHFKCREGLFVKFAYYLIKSPYFRRLIDGPDGAIGGVRHELFLSLLINIPLPIPTPARQADIVALIDSQLQAYATVRVLREQAQTAMDRIIGQLFAESAGADTIHSAAKAAKTTV